MTTMLSPEMPLDLFVAWKPLQVGGASFFSGLDNDSGTIRMIGGGLWHQADAQRYFDRLEQVSRQARRRFGALKVFIDVRDWIIESPESVTQFIEINRALFRAEDRLAAVVRSSANKQDTREAMAAGTREAFLSMSAAETWLQAFSNQRHAA